MWICFQVHRIMTFFSKTAESLYNSSIIKRFGTTLAIATWKFHCGLDLQLPDDSSNWTSLPMLTGYDFLLAFAHLSSLDWVSIFIQLCTWATEQIIKYPTLESFSTTFHVETTLVFVHAVCPLSLVWHSLSPGGLQLRTNVIWPLKIPLRHIICSVHQ